MDYDINKIGTSGNHIQLTVMISNYGLASAKHVVLSFEHIMKDVKFLNLTEEPIEKPVQVYSKNNQTGNAFFVIDTLPSRVETTVKANVDTVGNNSPNLTVYVRSDETVAHHNILHIAVVYLLLLILPAIWIYNRTKSLLPGQRKKAVKSDTKSAI